MMKALVIDDEIDICRILTSNLKRIGIASSFSTTLTGAWAKISEEFPELIFLDINLPDGSGLDALKLIKTKYPEINIIIISANKGGNERFTAFKYGASYFFEKPFTMKTINTAITAL
jgi:DNA-binding NtrC family response regulator